MSILLLTSLAAYAIDPVTADHAEVPVEVPGVGNVKLKDAQATCKEGVPQGEVAIAAGNTRSPAFQEVARGLLTQPSEVRVEYFKYHHDLDWPSAEVDVAYVPKGVSWVPPGVVGSCQAAGAFWVREGIRLSGICASDKGSCKDQFTPEDWEVAKEALKALKKTDAPTRDPFFAYLDAHADQLDGWESPLTYLDVACSWPQTAAGQSRFIDQNDLLAARRACLQIQILVTHANAINPVDQPCATPWRDVTADASFLVAAPATDLGMTADYADEQVEGIRDRLTRMDPSPERCGGDWAAIWRKSLVQTWRESQQAQACPDAKLPLADRVHLCPDLPAATTTACDAGDAVACELLGTMSLQGVGQPQDEAKAAELFLKACKAGNDQACGALKGRTPLVTSWIAERLKAATPFTPEPAADAPPPAEPPTPVVPEGALSKLEEARALIAAYGPSLDAEWAPMMAQSLFRIALSAKCADLAEQVLAEHGPKLPFDWVAGATTSLEALKTELAAPPAPPKKK